MDKQLCLNRIKKVKDYMKKEGIDLFLINPSANLKYLTGYNAKPDERLIVLVIGIDSEPFFIANRLYKPHIDETPITEAAYWYDGLSGAELLKKEINERNISTGTIAIDGSIQATLLFSIQEQFKQSKFVIGSKGIMDLRLIKDEFEINALMESGRLADLALKNTIEKLGFGWVGKTEIEFATEFNYQLTNVGFSETSRPIVAVGPNAAAPHHVIGNTKIEKGKSLLIDFGAIHNDYYCDMTRNFSFGKPSDKYVEIYNIVLEAQLKAEECIKVGMPCIEIDKVARDIISSYGYGEYFIHRLGHGIGLEVHEAPSIGANDGMILQSGMAFSVEPGIYLPNELGVRIEDIVIATDEGIKICNHFPKELTVID